jgi:hypothetical protein
MASNTGNFFSASDNEDQWLDIPMPTAWLALLVVVVTTLLAFVLAKRSRDPREPPVISPRVPFIGHGMELTKHGVDYFTLLQ